MEARPSGRTGRAATTVSETQKDTRHSVPRSAVSCTIASPTFATLLAHASSGWRSSPRPEGLMLPKLRFLALALLAGLASPSAVRCAADISPQPPAGCAGAVDNFFQDEVWAKVGRPK